MKQITQITHKTCIENLFEKINLIGNRLPQTKLFHKLMKKLPLEQIYARQTYGFLLLIIPLKQGKSL